MNEYVKLVEKRNRGWPWPEDSLGLTPMYGEDGWCHSCGVPNRSQSGSITLQRKSMKPDGAWAPYWRYDSICISSALADEVSKQFDVELLPVVWHASSPGDAFQILLPPVGPSWFDHRELAEKAISRHGVSGATCHECGVWRWMPVASGNLPPYRIVASDAPIIASSEWFGDGCKAYRQLLFHRELAELIASASPRDFKVVVPEIVSV